MKFRRNARPLRSQLDAAPFAAVFFLLVMFMMLSTLIYTPGARVELKLPRADGLSGATGRPIWVAVDADGRLYYQNQCVDEKLLRAQLLDAAKQSREPLTLVIYADKSLSYDRLMRLTVLARDSGIGEAMLAGVPGAQARSTP